MKTVLFGWDGATYNVLDHLVATGVMPNLANVWKNGCRGILESTALPLTPQAWTSMATGRTAGNHGLHDFLRPIMGPTSVYFHVNDSRDNCCETIWKYASRFDRRVTVLNWFGIAPPEPINGHSMPGFTSGRHFRRSCYPANLFADLHKVEGLNANLLGLDLEFERLALQDMPPEQWRSWIEHHIRREQVWFGILEHLMCEDPSDLTAIVLDGVDKIQHLAYRFLDPRYLPEVPTAWESEMISLCRQYFKQVDDFLGRLSNIVGVEGRLFIASDHGFTASHEIIYINKFLNEKGWLKWRQDLPPDEAHAIFSPRLSDLADAIDIANTQAFALLPSCNGIYLVVPPDKYESFREEVIRELLSLKAPDGQHVVRKVKKREDFFAGPQMHRIPDLTLELRDSGFISVLNARAVVESRSEITGTHHPDGVIMGVGAGIRPGVQLARLSILDVAPLLLHSLGLEIPSEYEGVFPSQFYDESTLASDPPRYSKASCEVEAATTPLCQEASDEALSPDDEAALIERLRSLGYV